MMKPRAKWRTALRWLAWLLLAVVLVIVLLPVWFPWAARPVLAHFGFQYGDYDRVGFTRFLMLDVRGEWQGTQFQTEEVECALPTAWLWTRLSKVTNREPELIVSNSLLTIGESTNAPPVTGNENQSLFGTLDLIQQIGLLLKEHLPAARLTNCAIAMQSTRMTLSDAEWRNGNLHARIVPGFAPEEIVMDATIGSDDSLRLAVSWAARETSLHGTFTRGKDRWNYAGEATWLTNRAGLSAQFSTNGWWPDQARLHGSDLRLPADLVRLQGYQDLAGTVALNLVSNQFSLQATGTALPLDSPDKANLPPVQATLAAHGNPESLMLDQLRVNVPWLQADLTNAIGIKRTGELLDKTAQLRIAMDLTRLPGMSLIGKATGLVSVEMGTNRNPVARFDVRGTGVGGWEVEAQTVDLRGSFGWPVLQLDGLDAQFEDGSKASVGGSFNLETRTLQKGIWSASGAMLQRFLPGINYSALTGSGTAQGSITQLMHSGTMVMDDLQVSGLKPLRTRATWQADGLKFSSAQVELAASDSVLSAGGEFDLSTLGKQLATGTIQKISLRRKGETLYALQQPCPIMFRQFLTNEAPRQWQLKVDAFNWRGDEKELSLTSDIAWPVQGDIQLKARRVAPGDFADFVNAGVSNVSITHLSLNAHWSNGPVQFSTTNEVSVSDSQGHAYLVKSRIESGDELRIQELTIKSEFAPGLSIEGTLPLQAVPMRGTNWFVANDEGAIALNANLKPSGDETVFTVGSLGKLRLSRPALEARASGTLGQPTATLYLGVEKVSWQPATNTAPGPKLEQLKLDAIISPQLIELRELSGNLEGQPIESAGQWPLPADSWKMLWANKQLPDWSSATGQLRMQDAKIEAMSSYLPELLAPEGRLTLQVDLAQGGKLGGTITLTNVATRPLGQLAPLRDIAARVRLDGSQAVLDDFHGQMGGQRIQATGRVEFPTGKPMNYQVHLIGSNVPLSRSIAFLLRGDLDVTLEGGKAAPTKLTGNVTLHHGLSVRYASEMLWSGPRRAELRPPYFSITNTPFADWNLDLNVQGNEFLRVRSPMFSGVVSSDMKLRGTLREPEVSGDARVNTGRILFPFGTLSVDEGYASLSGNDLRGPALQLRASGRTLDYEVRLEVTGPVDGANVVFSSTPPLNSEEILLLLTAGELPEKEYTFTSQARAGRLVSFLGKDLWARTSGSNEGESRLTINTGESISEEGKLTYSVEYRLADRWSIIGEYDRFNAFNANLKWKIISR